MSRTALACFALTLIAMVLLTAACGGALSAPSAAPTPEQRVWAGGAQSALAPTLDVPVPTATPWRLSDEERLQHCRTDYYTQCDMVLDIRIKAPPSVRAYGIEQVRGLIRTMLSKRPEVATRMGSRGASIAIFPWGERFTVLPEFSFLADTAFGQAVAVAEHGWSNVSSAPEVREGDDREKLGIAAHELAHNVLRLGLPVEDQIAWRKIYESAVEREIFDGLYASVNADECWAELSRVWFGFHLDDAPEIDVAWLQARLPSAVTFLERVYDTPS